jgi:hypothetical protein
MITGQKVSSEMLVSSTVFPTIPPGMLAPASNKYAPLVFNNDQIQKLVKKIKNEANNARELTTQILNIPDITDKVKRYFIDNTNELDNTVHNAQYEASKIIEDKMKKDTFTNVNNDRLKNINFFNDIINNFINDPKLNCQPGFIQQGNYCKRKIEGFTNIKESNILLILIIIILLVLLAYRNKEFVKKNFNITI